MRKKLILAIVVVLILIAAAICAVIYLESRQSDPAEDSGVPGTSAQDPIADATGETGEETIGLTFPTENSDEVAPEETFGEDNIILPVTGDYEDTGVTEDPQANETPPDVIE